jgi:transcription antitermination factor NusG
LLDSPKTAGKVLSPGFAPLDLTSRWYAAYSLSNHEKRVELRLEAKGIEVFLPLLKVVKRWKNRTTAIVQLPLFAGYVFVRIMAHERAKVLDTAGVLSLVGVAGKATPLPDAEVEALRSRFHLRPFEPYPYLKVGERARIRSGPLAGFEGIVVRKDDRLRIVLSIDLIMRSVAVHVEAHELEPVNSSAATKFMDIAASGNQLSA